MIFTSLYYTYIYIQEIDLLNLKIGFLIVLFRVVSKPLSPAHLHMVNLLITLAKLN